MAERTLEAMALGGIYDQIGGGFSRYSVDERWLVPHFEKMLYNQALLVPLYTRRLAPDRQAALPAGRRRDPGLRAPGDDRGSTAASTPHWTPTAKARRAGSTSGRPTRSVGRWETRTAGCSARPTASRRRAISRDAASPTCSAASLAEPAAAGRPPEEELAARLAPCSVKLLAARGAAGPAGNRRQDPHRLERPDDLGLRPGPPGARTGGGPGRRRDARPSSCMDRLMREDRLLVSSPRRALPAQRLPGRLRVLRPGTARPLRGLLRAALHPSRRPAGRHARGTVRGPGARAASSSPRTTTRNCWRATAACRTARCRRGPASRWSCCCAWPCTWTRRRYSERPLAGRWSRRGRPCSAMPSAYATMLLAADLAAGPTLELAVVGEPADPATRALLEVVRGRRPSGTGAGPGRAGSAGGGTRLCWRARIALDGRPTAFVCRDYACRQPTTRSGRSWSACSTNGRARPGLATLERSTARSCEIGRYAGGISGIVSGRGLSLSTSASTQSASRLAPRVVLQLVQRLRAESGPLTRLLVIAS